MKSNQHFTSNLAEESQKHVAFLTKLHQLGVTTAPVSSDSIDRYLHKWLPLVAANEGEKLIPPPDVAWLWHCHRLAPTHYQGLTCKRFGHVLEATPPFAFQEEGDEGEIELHTRSLWEQHEEHRHHHHHQREFFAQDTSENDPQLLSEARDLNGFNLIASTEAQKSFLWQISGPKYQDEDFIVEAVRQYYKFLKVSAIATKRNHPMVPTFPIDLIWHTHILVSQATYNDECIKIRGSLFHHDDSFNDRTEGGSLDQAFAATSRLWKEQYAEDYFVEGGMYRGEPPSVYFDNDWKPEIERDIVVQVSPGLKQPPDSRPLAWVNVKDTPFDPAGNKTFLPADPKGGNGFKEGYVFGSGSLGYGYYTIYSKEAYLLVRRRLIKQRVKAQQELTDFDCSQCLCLCRPSKVQLDVRLRLEDKLQKTIAQIAYVDARIEADGPTINLKEAEILKHIDKTADADVQRYRPTRAYYDNYVYVYTDYTFLNWAASCGGNPAAGGCGGYITGGGAGGGCGGGSCVLGGGCGGGGCGGGGCCGGGCGGC